MTRRGYSMIRRLIGDERGLALPLVTVAIPVIFGCSALAIDFGYVLQVQTTLQSKTDAAALAGAQGLVDGTYTAKANLYSASTAAGGVNQISGIAVGAPTITTRCSTTMANAGVACAGPASSNVIVVTQTARVPLLFGSAVNFAQMTVSATSTASAGGGNYPALNVMILIDNTSSMSNTDPNCSGKTKFQCALLGVQNFLAKLSPSVDYIGIEVFPGVTTASAPYDVNCSGTVSPVEYGSSKFNAPATATYTIVGLSTCTTGSSGNCYRTSNSATSLNSSSSIVKSVGTSSTTGCMKIVGGEGTYYADAINQAQSNLAAFKTSLGASGVNTQNVMILWSDGDATASSSSGQIVASKGTNECHAAITAAQNATAAGTWVYTVGTAPITGSGGCTTDTGANAITPYCTLLEMASKLSNFHSDTAPPSGACPNGDYGPPASSDSAAIFTSLGAALGSVRLIPNGTT